MRVTGAYLFGLAVVAVGLGPSAAPAQKQDVKAPDPLQGAWVFLKVEIGGEDWTKLLGGDKSGMTFQGTDYVLAAGDGTTEKGTFKTDPKARPATIDLTATSGGDKGKTTPGIYEVDGDTLRVCLAVDGGAARPTKFASDKGAPLMLATLKRKKAEK